jgi:amidase
MRRIVLIFIATFVLFACTTPTQSTTKAVEEIDVTQLTATDIATKIKQGEITSEQVVSAYLARIEQYDSLINSVIALNPNALQEAREKDKQVSHGASLGLLHGVPVLVKDNVETKELPTTAGSLALAKNMTGRDAPIIANLRAQGAIILGKTNLSEWANFRSNDSISGWSGVGGQTRNPHSRDRSACGSSSGTGAAIAAQFAPLGIGTETNGSIMCPSAMNGVVGFKPTVGMMSRSLVVPISSTQDTAGPMTRTVADAALMLSVMAGSDAQDSATLLADEKKSDFVAGLDGDIKGMKIGVLRWAQGNRPEVTAAFNQVVDVMVSLGAQIIDIDEFTPVDGLGDQELLVLETEFKATLNAYLSNASKKVKTRSLSDLIEFNKGSERELALFDQSLLVSSLEKGSLEDEEYKAALANILSGTRENGIDKLLSDYGVDILMLPSRPAAFLIDPVYGDNYSGGSVGAGWLPAIAGYPIITVPMGDEKGLPIGVGFTSTAWDDAKVLKVGHAYEQASHKIMTPTFAASGFEVQQTVGALSK